MSGRGKRTGHPLLRALDIVIVVLTLLLVLTVLVWLHDYSESRRWRLSADNYRYELQNGDYLGLARVFYGSYQTVRENELTAELEPYAAVAGYYLDSFLLKVYEESGDADKGGEARERLSKERSSMGVYAPEADKIDAIFSRVGSGDLEGDNNR